MRMGDETTWNEHQEVDRGNINQDMNQVAFMYCTMNRCFILMFYTEHHIARCKTHFCNIMLAKNRGDIYISYLPPLLEISRWDEKVYIGIIMRI